MIGVLVEDRNGQLDRWLLGREPEQVDRNHQLFEQTKEGKRIIIKHQRTSFDELAMVVTYSVGGLDECAINRRWQILGKRVNDGLLDGGVAHGRDRKRHLL